MSSSDPWPAPAKLNLMLHVTGQRADGYHTLQTVFQFLDHSDALEYRVRGDGLINRQTELAGVPAEQDLVVRAARLLQQETDCRLGVDISLRKVLPMGGGLGGGSSDAATTLVALNQLWGTGLSRDRLAALGLGLGADVPVFVHGEAAWAEGVGEQLIPLGLPRPWYVVIVPPVTVVTGEVFRDPELTRNSPPIRISDFVAGRGGNDCEAVVRRRYPAVGQALDWLALRGEARLTGTGACVFAPYLSVEAARGVLTQLPPGWRGFVARGANRSPLLDRLAERR